jgi:hypothetical protein
VVVSPDMGSFIHHHFGGRDLLQRSVVRNVTPKASAIILTTGMVATPSRRWKPLAPLYPLRLGAFHLRGRQLTASSTSAAQSNATSSIVGGTWGRNDAVIRSHTLQKFEEITARGKDEGPCFRQ